MFSLKLYTFFLMCLVFDAYAQNQCKLISKVSQWENVAIGFPRLVNRARTIGNLNITVLFVDFSDRPSQQTPQQIFAHVSPTTQNFFLANSYGKLRINLVPFYKWLRMSRISTTYNMSPGISFEAHRAYITEAVNLANSNKLDFSRSDLVLVMTNPTAGAVAYGPAFCSAPGWGVTVQGKEFINGVTSGADLTAWRNFWLIHELAHTFGLPDLYAFSGPQFGYTGEWSIMGNINAIGKELFGWERWLMGWLEDSQVTCISSSGVTNVNLSPIARNDTANIIKMIVVKLNDRRAIIVESRRSQGYDVLTKQGILAYLVDTSIRTGSGPIQVLPINTNDIRKTDSILTVGNSIYFENVSVTYVSNTSNNDQVRIVLN